MLEKKSCYLILSLMTGCLFMHSAAANQSGERLLSMNGLEKQQEKLAQSAGYSIQDAKSALLQARHVLLEVKHRSSAPDREFLRLQILADKAAVNLERARESAGRIESLKSRV